MKNISETIRSGLLGITICFAPNISQATEDTGQQVHETIDCPDDFKSANPMDLILIEKLSQEFKKEKENITLSKENATQFALTQLLCELHTLDPNYDLTDFKKQIEELIETIYEDNEVSQNTKSNFLLLAYRIKYEINKLRRRK